MCVLEKALYGHPESGGHWEQHLTEAIKAIGGEPLEDHPSTFWISGRCLLLTVYVDDLVLSGPHKLHGAFWRTLQKRINLEDAEPLDRFLGRTHIVSNI